MFISVLFFFQGITNDHVLIGYKPFSSTDEEFLICTTDKAKRCIEDTLIQNVGGEIKKKTERSMCRVPGPWESKSSDKDIEDLKPVQTREKVYLFALRGRYTRVCNLRLTIVYDSEFYAQQIIFSSVSLKTRVN